MSIRIIVIDDDPFVCASLATILDAQADLEVVATGTDGSQALPLFEGHMPDILLMDIQMPGQDGLSAAEKILAAHPDARIVFLTTFSDDEYIVHALRLGARGYLIKQDVANIAPALRSVYLGQSVLAGEVIERVDSLMASGAREPADGDAVGTAGAAGAASLTGASLADHNLTERESQIVGLIAEGLDNRQIAARVFMSEGTVRNHISTILQKLGLKNRTQIAIYFYRRQR